MIYFPVNKGLTLNLSFLSGSQIRVWWFQPASGEVAVPVVFQKIATMNFTPPSTGNESDWVLIIDDADAKFSQPGK